MILASEEAGNCPRAVPAHAGALSSVLGACYMLGETDETNTAPLPQETKRWRKGDCVLSTYYVPGPGSFPYLISPNPEK